MKNYNLFTSKLNTIFSNTRSMHGTDKLWDYHGPKS